MVNDHLRAYEDEVFTHEGENGTINTHSSNSKNVKKMCSTSKILNFTCPTYHVGKCSYVDFYCEDPQGSMRRKRIKLDHIKNKRERKMYAHILISNLMKKLVSGWSPWDKLDETIPKRVSLVDAVQKYRNMLDHASETGELRRDTIRSYRSYLNVFVEFFEEKRMVQYVDQISVGKIQSFLDHLVQDLGRSATTHNNYLVWLGTFCRWLNKHEYIDNIPTEKIKSLKENKEKNRKNLSDKELAQLKEYCLKNNKHYLLVCYLLYYCMIRPKELSMLTVGNIHLHEGVIHIPGNVSKNHKGANVTLPKKVIMLMLDLRIFDYPSSFYLFSESFSPGKKFRQCKPMSDYWDYHVRRDLGWGMDLKLYSLKDTGITNLLHKVDVLTVRDQARHSDISITNVYAQRSKEAVAELLVWDDDEGA